jgi:hypothetical protein
MEANVDDDYEIERDDNNVWQGQVGQLPARQLMERILEKCGAKSDCHSAANYAR